MTARRRRYTWMKSCPCGCDRSKPKGDRSKPKDIFGPGDYVIRIYCNAGGLKVGDVAQVRSVTATTVTLINHYTEDHVYPKYIRRMFKKVSRSTFVTYNEWVDWWDNEPA